jgi:hypothetical protein
MAWIVFDLDGTLVTNASEEEGGGLAPIPGSVETATRYANEGHRLTVFTAKFAPMPQSEKFRLKNQIEQDLAGLGFPPMEVWTGTTKPASDFYISKDAVTFDGDYNLLQAQLDYMMNERGLTQPQQEQTQDLNAQPQEQNDPPPENGQVQ